MSGKNLKRRKRPTLGNPAKFVPLKNESGLWIRDIAAKATYYPSTIEAFNRTCERLKSEGKELITSQIK